jgi:hypothetical protein
MTHSLHLEPGKQIVLLLAGEFDKAEIIGLIEALCGYPYRWGLWILSSNTPELPASIQADEIAGVLVPSGGGNIRQVLGGDGLAICRRVVEEGIPLGVVFMNPWRVIDLKPWFFHDGTMPLQEVKPREELHQGLTMPFRTA